MHALRRAGRGLPLDGHRVPDLQAREDRRRDRRPPLESRGGEGCHLTEDFARATEHHRAAILEPRHGLLRNRVGELAGIVQGDRSARAQDLEGDSGPPSRAHPAARGRRRHERRQVVLPCHRKLRQALATGRNHRRHERESSSRFEALLDAVVLEVRAPQHEAVVARRDLEAQRGEPLLHAVEEEQGPRGIGIELEPRRPVRPPEERHRDHEQRPGIGCEMSTVGSEPQDARRDGLVAA